VNKSARRYNSDAMTALSGWQNFYVIMGSSAGALIGLQFVTMTLIAQIPMTRDGAQAGSAFGTPNVIHFGTVLLLSGIACAPWDAVSPVAVLWGVIGVIGAGYTALIFRRMRTQTAYQPEFEDWLCHVVLPFIAYLMLAVLAWVTISHLRGALFGIAGVALLLLFTGIHNAWDAVTYHVYVRKPTHQESQPRGAPTKSVFTAKDAKDAEET